VTIDMVSIAMDRIKRSLSCERMDFASFIPAAWPLIEPSNALLPNWHIDCIAEHLEAVTLGHIQFLVINLPPRNAKSNIVSKLWPAWSWSQRPGLKWIFISYAQALAETFSKDRRDLIQSEWYQRRWGSIVRVADDQNQKREFMNTARGVMTATSVGGTLTGKGADIIVIDDGIDPERANSKADREAAIRFVKGTVSTRLNDKRSGAIVEISQRTHKQDISGTLLAEGIYVHLNLPAMAEKKTIIEFPISKKQIVREVGDPLHAAREDIDILARQQKQMTVAGKSIRTYQAQYQQNPTSDDGGMFKRTYWEFHKVLPRIVWRIWSWDTALEADEENDWTVGALICFSGAMAHVEKVVRERVQFPDLERLVLSEFNAEPANELLIENKVSGISLAQSLKRKFALPVIAYPRKGEEGKGDVRGDKVFRAGLASPYVESHKVSLKDGAIWVPQFIEELAEFPAGEFDDQVDAFSQGINKFYFRAGRPAAALVGAGIAMPAALSDTGEKSGHNGNGHKNAGGLPMKPRWA
jgi:predicted phage terminase large subunit-like protein